MIPLKKYSWVFKDQHQIGDIHVFNRVPHIKVQDRWKKLDGKPGPDYLDKHPEAAFRSAISRKRKDKKKEEKDKRKAAAGKRVSTEAYRDKKDQGDAAHASLEGMSYAHAVNVIHERMQSKAFEARGMLCWGDDGEQD